MKPEEVRDLRKEKGWTQKQLAEFAGVSRHTVINVEGGKNSPVTRTMDMIEAAFEEANIGAK